MIDGWFFFPADFPADADQPVHTRVSELLAGKKVAGKHVCQ